MSVFPLNNTSLYRYTTIYSHLLKEISSFHLGGSYKYCCCSMHRQVFMWTLVFKLIPRNVVAGPFCTTVFNVGYCQTISKWPYHFTFLSFFRKKIVVKNINKKSTLFNKCLSLQYMSQMGNSLPEMREIQVWSLGQEDPLEKGMATHSSILACRVPWTEEPGGLPSMGLQRVGHDWGTRFFTVLLTLHALLWALTHCPWRAAPYSPSPSPYQSPFCFLLQELDCFWYFYKWNHAAFVL